MVSQLEVWSWRDRLYSNCVCTERKKKKGRKKKTDYWFLLCVYSMEMQVLLIVSFVSCSVSD